MRKIIIISILVSFALSGFVMWRLYFNAYGKYNKLYKDNLQSVDIEAENAHQRTKSTLNKLESSDKIARLKPVSDNIVNDICLVDQSKTNTNVFTHLRSKVVGESMRCVYQVVKYYSWSGTAEEFEEGIRSSVVSLNLLRDYPFDELGEIEGTSRVIETDYSVNPAIQIRFGKANKSFYFTDTLDNYSDVIYQRRFKGLWNKKRVSNDLIDKTQLPAIVDSDAFVVQVTVLDRYYTFFDNHTY